MISYVCSNFDMPKFLSYIFAASSMNVCLLVRMRWNDKHDRCMLRFVMDAVIRCMVRVWDE